MMARCSPRSVAIVQYIADQVPAKQLAPPNGTFARTKLQSWLNFIASEIQMGCFCPLFGSDDICIPRKGCTVNTSACVFPIRSASQSDRLSLG